MDVTAEVLDLMAGTKESTFRVEQVNGGLNLNMKVAVAALTNSLS